MRFARVENGAIADFFEADHQAAADLFLQSVPMWTDSVAVADPPQTATLGTQYSVDTGFVLPVVPLAPQRSLHELRADAQQDLIEWAAQVHDQQIEGYTEAERKTWPEQEEEAKAYLASGNPQDAPMLATQADVITASGGQTTLAELCQKILDTANQLRLFSAAVRGIRQSMHAQIEQMSELELEQVSPALYDQQLQQILNS